MLLLLRLGLLGVSFPLTWLLIGYLFWGLIVSVCLGMCIHLYLVCTVQMGMCMLAISNSWRY